MMNGHHPDCDGYGYIHTCRAYAEPTAGHVLWRTGCPCGHMVPGVLAGSQDTAVALGRRTDHPWGTEDVCDGRCAQEGGIA